MACRSAGLGGSGSSGTDRGIVGGCDGAGLELSDGDNDAQETHVVWRESRSGVFAGEESCAEVGGVKEAGVLGELVGADESSEVDEEASSVGFRSVTRGMERSGAVNGP